MDVRECGGVTQDKQRAQSPKYTVNSLLYSLSNESLLFGDLLSFSFVGSSRVQISGYNYKFEGKLIVFYLLQTSIFLCKLNVNTNSSPIVKKDNFL